MKVKIRGAREHNLQRVNVDLGDGLTVVTGVSGSGKTSLVFDTLYHEAYRRFSEIYTLGATTARLTPARVDTITGLGPAVAVGQNLLNRNPNSTLATAAGLHPFLRLLYANFGQRACPRCQADLIVFSEDELVSRLQALSGSSPITVYTPLLRGVPGSHRTLLAALVAEFGRAALFIDGAPWSGQPLNPHQPHDLAIAITRLTPNSLPAAIRQAIHQAKALGATALTTSPSDNGVPLSFAPVCPTCGHWFDDLQAAHFHTPCPHCSGKGCEHCAQTGLHPQAAAVRWRKLSLPALLHQTVDTLHPWFASPTAAESATLPERLGTEIATRLTALQQVGLGYLSLDRPIPTLSRGEAQRIRLAVALTNRLADMLHILDEPTVGQHPADVARLLPHFRDLPGPVIYVEHDRLAAAAADTAIDLGPGAGKAGGQVIFSGPPADLWQSDTPTGRFFSLRQRVNRPARRAKPEQFLHLFGADLRTLQQLDVSIPVGRLTVISGVSGAGKSTLVEDVLVASLQDKAAIGCRAVDGPWLKPVLVDQSPIGRNPRSNPATYTNLAGLVRDYFAAQSKLSPSHFSFNRPEGACPACQGLGAVEIKMRYLPSTWIPCTACEGQRFSETVLAVQVPFGRAQLTIAEFYDLSVGDALALLSATEQMAAKERRTAQRILQALTDIGLDYLPLGQPSPTLSGGEAQRVKLAKYLGRRTLEQQLLVLDEPSTGLHPQDLQGLLVVLDRLVREGATVVVVEHNQDLIRAADWVIDLGPGAGPDGGRLLYAGSPDGLAATPESQTGQALQLETTVLPRPEAHTSVPDAPDQIVVRGARAHNLQGVDVSFPKRRLTVVTGLSGSGKSSLVHHVLEAEARRRHLEILSMYERQSTREGPEAPVEAITGLGVTLTVTPERGLFERRASVGTAAEISPHLAILFALAGRRRCLNCGTEMDRHARWVCPSCGNTAPIARPRHFSPFNYAAACATCNGVGSLPVPRPEKLIVAPDKPLCAGAMYSPGFFPKGFMCQPFNSGYDMLQALAARYDFDPATTPWNEMSPLAQQAFLFGTDEPLTVTYRSRKGRVRVQADTFPGFYGFIRDWDVGGTYTDTIPCPDCRGARLKPAFRAVTLAEHTIHQLSELPLHHLIRILRTYQADYQDRETNHLIDLAETSLQRILHRLDFLVQVGLGYLHLNRIPATLSAGEAQRVRLAGLLGSGLTALTVLLDEPSRGLHPAEVEALLAALIRLRDEGNTVIVVEHEPLFMQAADHLIDLGPGPGIRGGRVVAQGPPEQVKAADGLTAAWLRGDRRPAIPQSRREPTGWLTIRGARGNNLREETIRLPLGVLVGLCGVSGSGKSTLLIDTLGRALAPKKQTTSVAYEPIEPAPHQALEGAPERVILVDQARAGVGRPADFLRLRRPIHKRYAASADAVALGLSEKALTGRCSACHGRGLLQTEMGFLPDLFTPCEACRGSGYRPEAWSVRLHDYTLPELLQLTIEQVYHLFRDDETLARPLADARQVGLGYLVLSQPGYSLSGGEAQRLKIARELCRRNQPETLYLLDEPTVGQHPQDVARLSQVLQQLVAGGHSVMLIEHHPHLLVACDWLVEFGPGGGPDGGRIVAAGRPEAVAAGMTPTGIYLKAALEESR